MTIIFCIILQKAPDNIFANTEYKDLLFYGKLAGQVQIFILVSLDFLSEKVALLFYKDLE